MKLEDFESSSDQHHRPRIQQDFELTLPLHSNSPQVSRQQQSEQLEHRSQPSVPMANVQVVDASGSRRRGAGLTSLQNGLDTSSTYPLFDADAQDPYADPQQYQYPGESKEFKPGKQPVSKWDKLIPEDLAGKRRSTNRGPQATGWSAVWNFIKENRDQTPLIVYTILSLWTRLYRIGKNNTVVWDEAHFGKFGAYYLNQTFYFDVHPPLGKMLIGLAGALTGFNGSFDYPSGATYPDHVPFRAMRILMAMPGVAMVPLAWGTSLELGFTWYGRHIITLMVLCDLAWLVISRFVLLDSMLLFFTFCTVYCLAVFHNQQKWPFSIDWWAWLALTGISIGCVASVKWVGFFVTALVGLYTIEDLWHKFGDLRMPIRTYVKHWVARILCLMVLPFTVYVFCFKLHFLILNRSGPGDAQMSSLFQAHLYGNDFARNPLEPVYGSKITLKNMGYGGGLLHSHASTFPTGSKQQQVTCYHYKDNNNEWLITPTWEDPAVTEDSELRYLSHGSVVRFIHAATHRQLHSHPLPAPLTKTHNEVSGYGNETVGDSNDYWTIEVVDDTIRGKKEKFERIHSLTSRLRIKHKNSGCYLRAAGKTLPAWGFKQVEVTCDKENHPKDEHTYWNIENHWNERLPAGNAKLYRSPFFRDFWHLNVAMMNSNNALVPDPDKEDIIASSPMDWPFMHLGMRMNGWGANNTKYYLLGNPVVWYSGTTSLFIFVAAAFWYICRFQRKFNDFAPGEWDHFLYVGKIGVAGWAFQYVPYLIMGRVTYIHHYLPTLWFSVISCVFLLDHFIFGRRRFTKLFKNIVFTLWVTAILGVFWWFHGTAFGMDGDMKEHWGLQWRKSWNMY